MGSCAVDLSVGPGKIHLATHRGDRDRLKSTLDNEIVGEEIDLPIKHGLGKSRKSVLMIAVYR